MAKIAADRETSMAVPAHVDAEDRADDRDGGWRALTVREVRGLADLDEDTTLAAITAMRKHEIGISVGGMAAVGVGIGLLVLAGNYGWNVPLQALIAAAGVAVASVPVILWSSRRAFIAECASLGISKKLARSLYARVMSAQFRLEKAQPQAARDRALASSIAGSSVARLDR